MKPATEAWIAAAEVDYRMARRASEEPEIPDGVCNHAQQCIERDFKSLLEEAGQSTPRTHDLGTLLNLTEVFLPDLILHGDDIRGVSPFAVAVRYPGSGLWDDFEEEADLAEATMDVVRDLVRASFGLSDQSDS